MTTTPAPAFPNDHALLYMLIEYLNTSAAGAELPAQLDDWVSRWWDEHALAVDTHLGCAPDTDPS